MLKRSLRMLSSLLIACAFAVTLPAAAAALTLDEARASGAVGERPDGYVGAVAASPSAEIQALVDDVNGKRRAHYATIAKKNGTDPKAVAALSGQKLIEKAPPGAMIMTPQGTWVKK